MDHTVLLQDEREKHRKQLERTRDASNFLLLVYQELQTPRLHHLRISAGLFSCARII